MNAKTPEVIEIVTLRKYNFDLVRTNYEEDNPECPLEFELASSDNTTVRSRTFHYLIGTLSNVFDLNSFYHAYLIENKLMETLKSVKLQFKTIIPAQTMFCSSIDNFAQCLLYDQTSKLIEVLSIFNKPVHIHIDELGKYIPIESEAKSIIEILTSHNEPYPMRLKLKSKITRCKLAAPCDLLSVRLFLQNVAFVELNGNNPEYVFHLQGNFPHNLQMCLSSLSLPTSVIQQVIDNFHPKWHSHKIYFDNQ